MKSPMYKHYEAWTRNFLVVGILITCPLHGHDKMVKNSEIEKILRMKQPSEIDVFFIFVIKKISFGIIDIHLNEGHCGY